MGMQKTEQVTRILNLAGSTLISPWRMTFFHLLRLRTKATG